jgi:plastocyanin
MNICPVCRNVNQRDATICRFCGTTLTPPPPDVPAPVVVRRRRRWPWITGATALLLVFGLGGLSLFGGGGAAAGGPPPIVVGTDTGAALQFAPKEVAAPPNTNITLTFNNLATVAHNLHFQGPAITAKTADQVQPNTSESLEFTTPGPGSYQFVCTIHPGMNGQLVVR